MSKLSARTVKVSDVDDALRARLFEVFHAIYDATSRERFEKDFAAKDHVILLSSSDGVARGFSTLKTLTLDVDGRAVRGVFSGDTVIEEGFWGGGALGVEFLKYLFKRKFERPFQPLYWFLISKGYKTYLLMANNFTVHWPRYEKTTPDDAKGIMNAFAGALFGDAYDAETGLVRFDVSQGHLKGGIADIDDALRDRSPRVRFFEDQNPDWRDGTELVCLAEMRASMPFTYWWKKMGGGKSSSSPRARKPAASGA